MSHGITSSNPVRDTPTGGWDNIRHQWRKYLPLFVWLALFLTPVPAGLDANQWHYFAIFAAVISGLVFESMPPGAVGLIGLTAAAVLGYVEHEPAKSLRWALSGFSENTTWLIVGAFVFAIGYRKSGLGRRISLLLVRALGRRTIGLGYAVALTDLILAPATPSNTARSGGTVYPIVSNIPRIYGSEPGPTAGKMGTYVLWVAFATTAVTSSMFLTALAPNAAALVIAKKTAGVEVDWGQWFIGFAPLGVLLLVIVPALAYVVCRPEIKHSPEIPAWASNELRAMGAMSRNEWIMIALVALAVLLWIFGSNPKISVPWLGANFIQATTVVFLVISLMLFTGVVDFGDIVAEKNAWDVLLFSVRC
jgi:anion transporter